MPIVPPRSGGEGLVRIVGGNKLRRTILKAGGDLTKLKEANARVAAIVLPRAQQLVPVGTSEKLKKSLRASATTRAGILRAGKQSVPYAGIIHWGWPARGIKGRPYLADASKQTESQWLPEYIESIDKILSEIEGL